MADNAPKQKATVVAKGKSPKGTAVYPWLNTGDTKFKAQGEFKVSLRLAGDVAEAFKETVDGYLEKSVDAILAEKGTPNVKDAEGAKKYAAARKKMKVADAPYKIVEDDKGNETGEIDFKFSSYSSFTSKSGEKVERKLPLFDSKGKTFNKIVFGGSEIVCAFNAFAWSMPATGTGVKLQLEAVQVLNLVSGGSGSQNAAGFGFEESEGYDAGEDAPTPSDSASEADGSEDF